MKTLKTEKEFVIGKHGIGYTYSLERLPETFTKSEREMSVNVLKRYMTDSEIIEEFNVKNAEVGDILNFLDTAKEEYKDGNFNLFYLPECVVGVCWDGDGWRVHTWGRVRGGWDGRRRVFSPATESSTPENSSASDTLTLISEIEERLAKLKSLHQ